MDDAIPVSNRERYIAGFGFSRPAVICPNKEWLVLGAGHLFLGCVFSTWEEAMQHVADVNAGRARG